MKVYLTNRKPALNAIVLIPLFFFFNFRLTGQQFMWFLYFFGGLNATEKGALLSFKRPQLVAIDWSRPGFSNVTVQKGMFFKLNCYPTQFRLRVAILTYPSILLGLGFWFSSHENWGWMQLPYTDVPLMKCVK